MSSGDSGLLPVAGTILAGVAKFASDAGALIGTAGQAAGAAAAELGVATGSAATTAATTTASTAGAGALTTGAASMGAVAVGGVLVVAAGSVGVTAAVCNSQKKEALQQQRRRMAQRSAQQWRRVLEQRQTTRDEVARELQDLQRQVAAEHEALQKAGVDVGRSDRALPRVVLLGVTGAGKSLLGNRLLGDTTARGKEGGCAVGKGHGSTTKGITEHVVERDGREVVVVDTGGWFDSDGDDRFNENVMMNYFAWCGGVNLFLLFQQIGDVDQGAVLRRMRGCLVRRLGCQFIDRHTVVVVTRVDGDFDQEDFAEKRESVMHTVAQLGEDPDAFTIDRVLSVGLKSYEAQVQRIFDFLPADKYCTAHAKSPLWDLRAKEAEKRQLLARVTQGLQEVRQRVAALEAE